MQKPRQGILQSEPRAHPTFPSPPPARLPSMQGPDKDLVFTITDGRYLLSSRASPTTYGHVRPSSRIACFWRCFVYPYTDPFSYFAPLSAGTGAYREWSEDYGSWATPLKSRTASRHRSRDPRRFALSASLSPTCGLHPLLQCVP